MKESHSSIRAPQRPPVYIVRTDDHINPPWPYYVPQRSSTPCPTEDHARTTACGRGTQGGSDVEDAPAQAQARRRRPIQQAIGQLPSGYEESDEEDAGIVGG